MAILEVMTNAELIAEIEALRAKAKRAAATKLSLKVSAKGAVSLYGLGRWPVTLYRSQWERVLGHADVIRDFIELNAEALSSKDAE